MDKLIPDDAALSPVSCRATCHYRLFIPRPMKMVAALRSKSWKPCQLPFRQFWVFSDRQVLENLPPSRFFGTRLTSSARVGCLRGQEKGRVGENGGGGGKWEKKGPNHRKTDILFVNVHVANVVEGGAVTPRCQLRHSRRCRRRRRLRIAAMF